jgi:hypothetical protein
MNDDNLRSWLTSKPGSPEATTTGETSNDHVATNDIPLTRAIVARVI